MVEIILQILSVIGVILLVVIIVVFLLVLLLLFWPFHYTFSWEGSRTEPAMKVGFRLSWLFGLVRAFFLYPEQKSIRVKLLWFTLFDSAVPGHRTHSGNSVSSDTAKNQNNTKTQQGTGNAAGKAWNNSPEEILEETPNGVSDKIFDRTSDGISDETSGEISDKASDGQSGNGLTDKILSARTKALSFTNKFRKIRDDITYYYRLLTKKAAKELYREVFGRVCKILKVLKPRKCKGNILIGTGSPDTTGYLCGLYGILLGVWGHTLDVTTDFEHKILEGTVSIKGRILIAPILYHGLRLLFNRKLRLFIKKVKREDMTNGRQR